MDYNTTTQVGRLTRDPELKQLPNGGNAVCSFSLANSRKWKDQNGQPKEETEFHNCVLYGKGAEVFAKYMTKGAMALISGRLKTRSWEKDGQKHYRTEIVVEQFQFGPKPQNSPRNDDWAPYGQRGEETEKTAPRAPQETTGGIEYPADDINPDDIPF